MEPLAACGDLVVTLQPISRVGERQSVQLSSSSDVLAFSFSKVLPGKYKGEMKGSENGNGCYDASISVAVCRRFGMRRYIYLYLECKSCGGVNF